MKRINRFKAMYFCFLLLSCTSPLQYAQNTKSKSTPGTAIFVMASQDNPISIQDYTLQYQSNAIRLDMHVPQFKNLPNKDFQRKLNKMIYTSAIQRKKEIIKTANSYYKDMQYDGLTSIPFEYIETFSNLPTIYPYFTVELYQYQYSGGAHGISELSYLNLDLEENKAIMLKDLFQEQVDYINIINQMVNKEIERRRTLGEFFFTGSDGFETIKPEQPYFINKNGDLVIVFNVYEIAPYASGAVFIVLPSESVLPYLK